MTRILFSLAFVLATSAADAQSIHDRIYPAPHAPLTQAALPAGARLVTVTTQDGLALTGAEIAAKPDRPTLLIFHGNGSNAAETLAWFAPLIREGWGIVAAEYRGYSANPGRADEPGLTLDAGAFYAEAKRLAAGGHLFVVGHSLGGGVAFDLAMHERLEALVTIGTFSRLHAVVPPLARFLVSDRYDNLADVPRLREPLFLIHGTADKTVPRDEEGILVQAARGAHNPGRWFQVTGASHHPDGAIIAGILKSIDDRLEHPGRVATSLPAGVSTGGFAP